MGTKNNPKNRGDAGKKVVFEGEEVEPVMYYDTDKRLNYLSAKVSKSNDIICDSNNNPIRWESIMASN